MIVQLNFFIIENIRGLGMGADKIQATEEDCNEEKAHDYLFVQGESYKTVISCRIKYFYYQDERLHVAGNFRLS